MRKKIGLGVLCVGLVAIGLWVRLVTVPQMETTLRNAAEAVVAPSVHGIKVQVSGREIALSGLADTDAELAEIKRALQALEAEPIVRAEGVQILAPAQPFVVSVRKADGLTISGNVPSEAVRLRLEPLFGDQVSGLVLASGAPQDLEALIAAGMTALTPMLEGGFDLEGQVLILRGSVAGIQEAIIITDSLRSVQTPIINGVRVLDDGAPAKYGLNYQRIGGTSVRGKLPKGLTVAAMETALGVPKIKGDVKIATAGEVGEADYLTAWAGVLNQLESMTSSVNGADRKVLAKLIQSADVAQVQAALETGGFVVQISGQSEQIAEGETRSNPDTGLAEVYSNGTWTVEPVATAQDLAQCQAATDAILATSTVVFLPNSDELDATGDGVVAQLVQAMLPCAAGTLRAEIGGHTDTSGDADKNLTLSQLRADRVRSALVSAGLPDAMLTAKGYGPAQPISENETAEGRAKNRRTTVTWSQ